jgi:hypothetical protein
VTGTTNVKKRKEQEITVCGIDEAFNLAMRLELGDSKAAAYDQFDRSDPCHGFALAEAWALLMLQHPGAEGDVEAHLRATEEWCAVWALYRCAFEILLDEMETVSNGTKTTAARRVERVPSMRRRTEYVEYRLAKLLGRQKVDVWGWKHPSPEFRQVLAKARAMRLSAPATPRRVR